MQLTKQTSGEDTWFVLTAQLEGTARFPELPTPANDAASRPRPAAAQSRLAWEDDAPPARPVGGLLRAMKRAARWLAAETLFGFAICGSAAHSCPLDPSSRLYARYPDPGSAGNPS